MNKSEYFTELESIRSQIAACSDSSSLPELYEQGMYGCVLVAEEQLSEQQGGHQVASLAREFLSYAQPLLGNDAMADGLERAAERMADTVSSRPRLKLQLLQLWLAAAKHNGSDTEDIAQDIARYEQNIAFADSGHSDKIVPEGFMRHDSVEWSKEWEQAIDAAEEKVYISLADHPRGMGFCHAYWSSLRAVLKADYGIEWRSPAMMNPGVMFD